MEINLKKTEIIVFRNGGPLRHYEHWSYNGFNINVTSMYKYMGLLFTPKLSWTAAKTKLASQARKSIYALKNYQKSFGYFLYTDTFKLFDSMVTPILSFGSEIWGYEYSNVIEQVQTQFCREYLGLGSSTNNCMVLGESGRHPMYTVYFVKCIKYWIKLLTMPENRYPKQCYRMLKSLDDIGKITWATRVKDLLNRYGFGYAWIAQDVGDENRFITQFKLRLTDCSTQEWQNQIQNSSRCDLYKNIKSLLDPEKYLSIDIPFHLRKAYSRFRCSSHKLHIETGRHLGVDREFRTCLFCFTNSDILEIEDEYHVFFICSRFNELRQTLLFSWYSGNTNIADFYNILKSQRTNTIRKVAHCI